MGRFKTCLHRCNLLQINTRKINVSLSVFKTIVALIKHIFVPKLELCSAHLLAKLCRAIMNTLKKYSFDVYVWTDSKVVLSWLSAHPRKWKTFVLNQTSEIVEVLPTKYWKHVPSKENPFAWYWSQLPSWLHLVVEWPQLASFGFVSLAERIRFQRNQGSN